METGRAIPRLPKVLGMYLCVSVCVYVCMTYRGFSDIVDITTALARVVARRIVLSCKTIKHRQ